MPNARSTAAADAVTGMASRLVVTASRRQARLPQRGPHGRDRRQRRPEHRAELPCAQEVVEQRRLPVRQTAARKAVSAAWSRTLSVTSRRSLLPGASAPSLTAPRGIIGGVSAATRTGVVFDAGFASDGAADARAPPSARTPAVPTARNRLRMFICSPTGRYRLYVRDPHNGCIAVYRSQPGAFQKAGWKAIPTLGASGHRQDLRVRMAARG